MRSAGFAVPGALGIQEGGFILLGSMFGLGAANAVALSLVKRLPEPIKNVGGPVGTGSVMKLTINLPLLVYWQALEAALLRRVDHPAGVRRESSAQRNRNSEAR